MEKKIITEELTRMLSIMNYDRTKTINENKQVLVNEMGGMVDQGTIGSHALAGAAMGTAMGSVVPGFGNLVGAVVGGVVGAAAGLIAGASGSKLGVATIFNACHAKGMGKSTMDGGTLDQITDEVFFALDGMGTDEEKLKGALSRIATIPDLCAVAQRYRENHPGASLLEDIDGDIDSDSEWNQYVYRPLLNALRKTKEISDKAKQTAKTALTDDQKLAKAKKCGHSSWESYKTSGWKCTPAKANKTKTNTTNSYKCSGTYHKGCMSEVIRKVQGCLSLPPIGKFGNKTEAAVLAKLNKNTFTDADVNTLCAKATSTPPNPDEEINQGPVGTTGV